MKPFNGMEPSHTYALRQCGMCGFYSYDNDRYCAYCGIRIRRRCAACNAEIGHPVAFYCADCGTPLPEKDEQNPSHINSHNTGKIS